MHFHSRQPLLHVQGPSRINSIRVDRRAVQLRSELDANAIVTGIDLFSGGVLRLSADCRTAEFALHSILDYSTNGK